LIDFRYHVVSIVAVFLALTVGLVIGSSYLSKVAYDELNNQLAGLRSQNQGLHTTQNQLTTQVHDRDSLIAALGPDAVKGKLTGHSVAVVTLPEADKSVADATSALLLKAGADVTGEITVKGALVDPGQASKVAKVSASVAADWGIARTGPQAVAPASAFADLAASIVRKTPADPDVSGPTKPVTDAQAAAAFAAYSTSGYIDVKTTYMSPADLVVVIAPPPGQQPAADVENGYYLGFVKDLDGGKGTVIAGPAASVAAPGLLNAALKDGWTSKNVSTADSADVDSGRIITIFALAEELTGKIGHYGLTGTSDGPLPNLGQ
jgi:hypothetical protein